jgi:hypothetical protein
MYQSRFDLRLDAHYELSLDIPQNHAGGAVPTSQQVGPHAMIQARIVEILMVGSLAAFAGLVTLDNLIDY